MIVIAWEKGTERKKTLTSKILGRGHSLMGIVNFYGVCSAWFVSAILSGAESTAVREKVHDALESHSTQCMIPSLHIRTTFKTRSTLDNIRINIFSVSCAPVQTPVFPTASLTLKSHILNPKATSTLLVSDYHWP